MDKKRVKFEFSPEEIQDALYQYVCNNPGYPDNLINRYQPVDMFESILTEDESSWLESIELVLIERG